MLAIPGQETANLPVMARAIVSENNDPDKTGRIRVEYPWFHGDSAEMPSEWARILMPYASDQSGSWFVPEIGDEVIVYFEGGNIDYPIVMGSLYSPKKAPPVSGRTGDLNDNNKNDLKFIKSREGNLICFDDSSENAGIVVQDSDKRKFEIRSKDKKVIVSDEKENQVELDGEKISLNHSGGCSIIIEKDSITIEGTKDIKLGKSAAEAIIKGDAFMTLFNQHSHPTAWGPSGAPSSPMNKAHLSEVSKTT